MKNLLGWTLSFLVLVPQVSMAGPAQLIRLYTSEKTDIRILADSGADVVGRGDGWVDVVVPASEDMGPQAEASIKMALNIFERREVIVKDLDTLLDEYRDKADLGAYHTVKEVHDELTALAEANPQIARMEVIGKTFEGRNIEAIVVGPQGAKANGKPRFFVCGAHHSREWISIEVPMALAKKLVGEYSTNAEIKGIVDSRVTWIVPILNPDGVNYSQTASKMWRKNRRKNKDGSFGVDPNRNYGYEWGGAGASTWPGSDTYRGEHGFSEPETAAVRDLAKREKFAADISFHSYSELVFWPWSYTDDTIDKAHEDIFKVHAKEMAKLNGYTACKSSDLYCSSGDFDDFMFGEMGSLSFTVELAQTFIPSESQIPEICEKNVASCLYVLKNCEDAFPRMAHTPPATSTAEGTLVEVSLNTELYPNESVSSVKAVYTTTDGSVQSTELPAVAAKAPKANPRFSGMVPQAATSYHFEYTARDGQQVRWPPYREFTPPPVATEK